MACLWLCVLWRFWFGGFRLFAVLGYFMLVSPWLVSTSHQTHFMKQIYFDITCPCRSQFSRELRNILICQNVNRAWQRSPDNPNRCKRTLRRNCTLSPLFECMPLPKRLSGIMIQFKDPTKKLCWTRSERFHCCSRKRRKWRDCWLCS